MRRFLNLQMMLLSTALTFCIGGGPGCSTVRGGPPPAAALDLGHDQSENPAAPTFVEFEQPMLSDASSSMQAARAAPVIEVDAGGSLLMGGSGTKNLAAVESVPHPSSHLRSGTAVAFDFPAAAGRIEPTPNWLDPNTVLATFTPFEPMPELIPQDTDLIIIPDMTRIMQDVPAMREFYSLAPNTPNRVPEPELAWTIGLAALLLRRP